MVNEDIGFGYAEFVVQEVQKLAFHPADVTWAEV
jgi:hypothetical protein